MTNPRERPILFAGPMVRAILGGRKTQTRRVVKPQPPEWVHPSIVNRTQVQDLFQWTEPEQTPPRVLRRWPADHYMRSPFGFPVQRLWVRETFYCDVSDDHEARLENLYYPADSHGPLARACCDLIPECQCFDCGKPKWRPSIHMPRWASRLTLGVTGVRVERLQDISEADALAEGVDTLPDDATARERFRALWESISGADSWDANPWVWVVEFRRVEVPHG